MNLFRFVPGYENVIYESGREPALVMLVAFLLTYVLARGYTRIARVRGWGSGQVGGVHLHHLVVGLILAFAAGAMEFAYLPEEGLAQLLLAAAFGSGAALVLDEFALVFHLDDVYWEEEGRKSVDAVVLGVGLGAVLLLHSAPLGKTGDEPRAALTVVVVFNLALVVVAALKGKLVTATFGVFVPTLAFIGAIRLAEPGSLWARRRYEREGDKWRRAVERYARYEARWRPIKERAWDLIGGQPERRTPPAGRA